MAHVNAAKTVRPQQILMFLLLVPAVAWIFWFMRPNDRYFEMTWYATWGGMTIWPCLTLYGMLAAEDGWGAVMMVIEFAFGTIVLIWLFTDWPRNADSMYAQQLYCNIPTLLMGKQIGRTAVLMVSETLPAPWHFWLDCLQILAFVILRYMYAQSLSDILFVTYSSAVVFLAGFFGDYMLKRLITLFRSHELLLQTAFTAVLRLNTDGVVLEDCHDFDRLIDGQAKGLQLQALCTADKGHIAKLLSSSSTPAIRRLRTNMIYGNNNFQQEVEFRVLASTDRDRLANDGLLLGVSVMGERLPYMPQEVDYPSTLIEQNLDDHKQLYVVQEKVELGGVDEIACFDSVSVEGRRHRGLRRRQGSSVSSFSGQGRNDEPRHNMHDSGLSKSQVPICNEVDATIAEEHKLPFGEPWLPSNKYLDHCSLGILEDLMRSWNFPCSHCCNFHSAVQHLAGLMGTLRLSACSSSWPACEPSQQCGNCRAMLFDTDGDACWVCNVDALGTECMT